MNRRMFAYPFPFSQKTLIGLIIYYLPVKHRILLPYFEYFVTVSITYMIIILDLCRY